MVSQASLVNDLQSIVGAEYARRPLDAAAGAIPQFAVDGMKAQVVASPGSYEEVAAVMRYAGDNDLAVIPWGWGSLMHLGNVPRRYDIALSITRLDKIVEYEPADLTVTCQAGISINDLWNALREAGQMTPFGPPWSEFPTIGGLLAANYAPHMREAYGTPRDFTIGMRVVTADGRITRAGGKVVKNVAGYDLCKLYIGSLGTLGVIVEATFKLVPAPGKWQTMALRLPSYKSGYSIAAEALARGLAMTRVTLHNQPGVHTSGEPRTIRQWDMVVVLPAGGQGAQRSRDEIGELANAKGGKAIDWDPYDTPWDDLPREADEGWPFSCRIFVLPDRVPALIATLEEEPILPKITASPTGGDVWVSWHDVGEDSSLVERLRKLAITLQGSLRVEECGTELKRRIDVFGDPPPAFELMRRVKQEFDPKGILSPGRFVGRL